MMTFIIVSVLLISLMGAKAAPNTVSITFNLVGIGNDTTRTVLRIDGTRYLASALPVTFDWTPGSSHTVYYADSLVAVYGKQYIFQRWENAQGMIGNQPFQELKGGEYQAPISDEVVTAVYRAQYFLTLKARSIKPAPSIESKIQVYFNNEPKGNITETTSITSWENDTSAISIAVDPTIPVSNGTGYTFVGWDDGDTNNPRTVNVTGTASYQAIYQAQFQVSFSTIPEQGTITPTDSAYYNQGSTFSIIASPKPGYAFSKWKSEGKIQFENSTHSTTRALINGPGVITVEFIDSVWITFTANKTQSDAQGSLITIDGTSFSYSQLPQVFKWTPQSTHTVTSQLFVPIDVSKRYRFIGWFGASRPISETYIVPNSNSTVIIRYRNQYFIDVQNGGHSTVTGAGWYSEGENATIMVNPPIVSGGTAIEWVFSGWSSSGSYGYNGSNSSFIINVKNSFSETAMWTSRPVQLSRFWIGIIWGMNVIILLFGVLLFIRWLRTR
jgi:hypothetical protein